MLANILMIAYYTLSMSQSIPCIIKLVKTKKSHDYSLINRALQYTALLCWTAYLGLTIDWSTDAYLMIIGIIDVLFLTVENLLIIRYYKNQDYIEFK